MASVACAYKQTLCEQRIRILCLSKQYDFLDHQCKRKKTKPLYLIIAY